MMTFTAVTTVTDSYESVTFPVSELLFEDSAVNHEPLIYPSFTFPLFLFMQSYIINALY